MKTRDYTLVCISGQRHELSSVDRALRHERLGLVLSVLGYAHQEASGKYDGREEQSHVVHVYAPITAKIDRLRALAKAFEQESILVVYPTDETEIQFTNESGYKTFGRWTEISLHELSRYNGYTIVNDRAFTIQ